MQSSIKKFQKLLKESPRPSVINWENINCQTSSYTNNSWNAFYSLGCGFCETILYCYWVYGSKDCTDLSYCFSCESCYECTDCNRCYHVNNSTLCQNCSYLNYCRYMENCSYCFGCVGLSNRTYYIFNKPYKQADYLKKVKSLVKLDHKKIQKEIDTLLTKFPRPAIISQDSKQVTGNYLYQCENCISCFDAYHTRNSLYCNNTYENVDSLDNSFSKATFSYETIGGGMHYNSNFCVFCEGSQDCYFCYNCKDCKNCFGCVNISHKSYYIFNKSFTEREYIEKTVLLKKEFTDAGMYSLDVFL